MTELEWLASDRPDELLFHLRDRLDDRDLRCLAAAFCRRAWDAMGQASRDAVEAVERHAAGREPASTLREAAPAAAEALQEALRTLDIHVARNGHRYHAAYAAAAACWLPGTPIERDPRRGEPEGMLDAAVRAAVHALYAVAIARTQHDRPVELMHARLAEVTHAESRAQAEIVRKLFPFRPIRL